MKTKQIISLIAVTFALATSTKAALLDDISTGLGNVTNWAVAPYFTYAPDAPTKYGGGILALYNVNQNVGVGTGVDWLGSFSLVSANVTLRLPTRPLTFMGFSNFVATPFVLAGVGTPFGGAGGNNGAVSTIEGAGMNFDVAKIKGWNFGFGYAYDNWTSVGAFSGRHHQGFVKLSKGF